MNHKLNAIRRDLIEISDKFSKSEPLIFGDSQAVCIDIQHMKQIIKILRSDADELRSMMEKK